MSHPSDDELVDLAIGEPVGEPQRAHVAGCDRCTAALEQLRRAGVLTGRPTEPVDWQPPRPEVWERIAAELDAPVEPAPEAEPTPTPPTTTAHALPAPPGAVHPLPAHPGAGGRRPHRLRRRTVALTGALVAASLVVGLLTGRAIWGGGDGGRVSQVALSTLDTAVREGEATVLRARDGLDLRVVTDRPLDAGDGYLEVWLLNADGKRMVSVGVLGQGESGTFPISQSLIDQGYVVVDISRELYDDKPAHSGDSLLRGRLPA